MEKCILDEIEAATGIDVRSRVLEALDAFIAFCIEHGAMSRELEGQLFVHDIAELEAVMAEAQDRWNFESGDEQDYIRWCVLDWHIEKKKKSGWCAGSASDLISGHRRQELIYAIIKKRRLANSRRKKTHESPSTTCKSEPNAR